MRAHPRFRANPTPGALALKSTFPQHAAKQRRITKKSEVLSFVMRQRHVCAVAVVAALAGTAGAQLSVHAPVNRSVVNSPFYLLAESASCQSQPTASMAYSVDSGSDVVTTRARLLQTTISAANGSHALHVKAWGN